MLEAGQQLFDCIIWPYLIVIVLGGYGISKGLNGVKVRGMSISNNLIVLLWSIPATSAFIGLSYLDGSRLTGNFVCYFQTFIFANTFWAYLVKYIVKFVEDKLGVK
ncbi:hypothetical protein N9893_02950 [bacterium]|nr:hypothetical protein [bacterium]